VCLMSGSKIFVISNEKLSLVITVGTDVNGNPTLYFREDLKDFDDFVWGL